VSASAQTDATSAKPLSGDVTVSKPVPSDRADTTTPVSSQPYDVNKPTIASSTKPTPDTSGGSLGARDTSKIASGFGTTSARASEPNPSSMIPSASVTASASVNNANASVNTGVSTSSEGGSLPPCGWPTGAKGGFLNDAQVTHAVLIANSVDSAVSAGILTRTQNPAVRDFAQMMVRDHTDANRQVAAIIDRTHIAPAENDISASILSDTTGHTFASVALSTRVMGQTVTPVTQPAPATSSYSAPKPKAERVDTVAAPPLGGTGSNPAVKSTDAHVNTYDYNSPSSATATVTTAPVPATATTCSNGTAGMSMTTTTTTPNSSNPPSTTSATVTTPNPAATPACTPSAATATPTPLTGDDKNYIDYMVQSHQQVLDALDNRLIPFAWNPDLRSALEAMKPVVQRHLDRAREIQRGQTGSNY
jgi:predicted outer membrane protein